VGTIGDRLAATAADYLFGAVPMSDLEIIPQHEPEIVAAIAAKHYRGDDEKVATTSIKLLTVVGVKIESRYQKAREFELMRDMVLSLPLPLPQGAVQSIFCDSKAGSCFSVALRRDLWNTRLARTIGFHFEQAAFAYNGGHNGITVSADIGDRSIEFSPNWGECE
jgi:hypothetical protein